MRRRKSKTKALTREDGSLTHDPAEMEGLAMAFYKTIFSTKGTDKMSDVRASVPVKVNS